MSFTTTLVTAYFPLAEQSKYNERTYELWIANLLENIITPMIVYTTSKFAEKVRQNRSNLVYSGVNNLRIVETTLEECYTYKRYKAEWIDQHAKDPENKIHSPMLYVIWNEKSRFLRDGAVLNPFNTTYFLWVDIGCFRYPSRSLMQKYRYWPSPSSMKNATVAGTKIVLLSVGRFTEKENQWSLQAKAMGLEDLGPRFLKNDNRIGGGIFGGARDIIDYWCTQYYDILDKYILSGRFSGKDQHIMATLALKYPQIVSVISPPVGYKNNIWFYLHEHLNQSVSPIFGHIINIINDNDKTGSPSSLEVQLYNLGLSETTEQFYTEYASDNTKNSIKNHIAVLNMAQNNNWPFVVVLGNCGYLNQHCTSALLEQLAIVLIERKQEWDVVALCCDDSHVGDEIAKVSNSSRLLASGTKISWCTNYIIQNHYYNTLLKPLCDSVDQFCDTQSVEALNNHFTKLNHQPRWWVLNPSVCLTTVPK